MNVEGGEVKATPFCQSFLTAVLLGILRLTASTSSKIYMALLVLQVKVFVCSL